MQETPFNNIFFAIIFKTLFDPNKSIVYTSLGSGVSSLNGLIAYFLGLAKGKNILKYKENGHLSYIIVQALIN